MPTVDVLIEPGEMTRRARWYLAIASLRHLLTGGFALLAGSSFKSSSFGPLLSVAPLWFWAIVFLGAGAACGAAAIFKHEGTARLGMAWSATSTLIVGLSLVLAIFTGQLSSPTGPIIWLAVAGKDFVVCAQPIRSPFEGLGERIARKRPAPR
jgi:hypothetical protein